MGVVVGLTSSYKPLKETNNSIRGSPAGLGEVSQHILRWPMDCDLWQMGEDQCSAGSTGKGVGRENNMGKMKRLKSVAYNL